MFSFTRYLGIALAMVAFASCSLVGSDPDEVSSQLPAEGNGEITDFATLGPEPFTGTVYFGQPMPLEIDQNTGVLRVQWSSDECSPEGTLNQPTNREIPFELFDGQITQQSGTSPCTREYLTGGDPVTLLGTWYSTRTETIPGCTTSGDWDDDNFFSQMGFTMAMEIRDTFLTMAVHYTDFCWADMAIRLWQGDGNYQYPNVTARKVDCATMEYTHSSGTQVTVTVQAYEFFGDHVQYQVSDGSRTCSILTPEPLPTVEMCSAVYDMWDEAGRPVAEPWLRYYYRDVLEVQGHWGCLETLNWPHPNLVRM